MKKLLAGFGFVILGISAYTPAFAASPCGVPALTQCPTPLDTTLPAVKDMLTWDKQDRVVGFRNDYRSYPGDVFKHATPRPLPRDIQDLSNVSYSVDNHGYDLQQYINRNNVTGLMVIKNGTVVVEYYGQGNTAKTLWTSRSVGKSVVSTLVGVAVKDGKIQSLDDKIVKYNPDVAGTVWENVSVRQLLQHTSGVEWSENYENPKSDFAQLTQCEAGKDTYSCVHDLIISKNRKAYAKPGEAWSYSSGGAWLLGDTLEKAVGMPIAQYLQEKVWQPYGMVNDGVWHSYQVGKHDVGAHGFNATLEDWGKFGQFVLENGALPNGQTILPDNWVADARSWNQAKNSVTSAHPEGTYGYEWWNNSVPQDAHDVSPKTGLDNSETMWGLGIFGQMMMINQKENLVIIQWSTWPKAEPSFLEQPLEASLMFNAIANRLKQ
ncbi:serine hydrolase domain-containing protein [Bartonella sp. LJL80]